MALRKKGFYFALTLLLAYAIAQDCKDPYSEWFLNGNCSSSCGACGTGTYERICRTGCNCTEPLQRTATCGFEPCLFPQKSCCEEKKRRLVARKFICF